MSEGGRVPIRRRGLAVLLGLGVALLLAEGALRVAGPTRRAPREDHYALITLDPDPARLHWGFDPQRPSWHAWDGDPYGTLPPGARLVYDDVNVEGLRGPLPPDDGTPRVLFLGDSFTFGEGVVGDRTLVARVQAGLVESGVAAATLNAGVPGYGTFEESLRLPALLDRFAPRAVVVVFTPNDPIHVSESKERGDDLLRFDAPEKWSALCVVELVECVLSSASADTERWYLDHYVGGRRDAWERARSLLVEMGERSERSGARFGVAYFPLLHRLGDGPLDEIGNVVGGACAEADIPFLDLTPAFEGLGESSLWVHPTDHHPNARAHAAAASALVPFVRDLLTAR